MKNNMLILLLILSISIFGCSKSQTSQSQTRSGTVLLTDASDSFILTNGSGTTITVEHSDPLISVQTDVNGIFQLPKLKSTGNMVLVYSHTGYGVYKQFFTSQGWDSLQTYPNYLSSVILEPMSAVVVNSLSGVLENDTLKLNCNVSVPNQSGQGYIAFVHTKNNPSVSIDNLSSSVSIASPYAVRTGDNSLNLCLCMSSCKNYNSGDTIFIKAYGAINYKYGTSIYFDPENNTLIYPSLNENSNSQTLSFVIP
jgi:hypothetical protein